MRARKSASTSNLDSLLDTMTNVVGILVILMAVTQLSVGEAVRRARRRKGTTVPVATVQDVEEARKRLDEIKALLGKLKKRWGVLEVDAPKDRLKLKDIQDLIAALKRELKDPIQLRGKRQELENELKRLKAAIKELQKDIARLAKIRDKLLAELGRTGTTPPVEVKYHGVPIVTTARKGTERAAFICRRGKVYPFDSPGLQKRFVAAVRKVVRQPRGKITLDRNDFLRIVRYFKDRDVGNADFRLRVTDLVVDLVLKFEPRARRGYTIEELRRPGSPYQRIIQGLDPKKRWVYFLVCADSFQVYQAARDIAEKKKLPAGWVPFDVDEKFQMLVIRGGGAGTGPPVGPDR